MQNDSLEHTKLFKDQLDKVNALPNEPIAKPSRLTPPNEIEEDPEIIKHSIRFYAEDILNLSLEDFRAISPAIHQKFQRIAELNGLTLKQKELLAFVTNEQNIFLQLKQQIEKLLEIAPVGLGDTYLRITPCRETGELTSDIHFNLSQQANLTSTQKATILLAAKYPTEENYLMLTTYLMHNPPKADELEGIIQVALAKPEGAMRREFISMMNNMLNGPYYTRR